MFAKETNQWALERHNVIQIKLEFLKIVLEKDVCWSSGFDQYSLYVPIFVLERDDHVIIVMKEDADNILSKKGDVRVRLLLHLSLGADWYDAHRQNMSSVLSVGIVEFSCTDEPSCDGVDGARCAFFCHSAREGDWGGW